MVLVSVKTVKGEKVFTYVCVGVTMGCVCRVSKAYIQVIWYDMLKLSVMTCGVC